MTERRYYRFAGLEFQVEMEASRMYREERRLAPFRVEAVTDPHIFRFEVLEKLPPLGDRQIAQMPNMTVYALEDGHVRCTGSGEYAIRAEHRGKQHLVQLKKNDYTETIGTKTVLESMEIEHLIARNDGFLFHCSYIAMNGRAILFTAPSETGKSTQAELWHKYRGAEIINGDRAAVRLVDGVLMAEGIPFAGSSQYCRQGCMPIAAIVYLGQAPVTTVRKLRGYEAFCKIWEGVSVNTWDKEDMARVSHVVQMLAEQIPVFHMPCTPDEAAVQALEAELRKQESL